MTARVLELLVAETNIGHLTFNSSKGTVLKSIKIKGKQTIKINNLLIIGQDYDFLTKTEYPKILGKWLTKDNGYEIKVKEKYLDQKTQKLLEKQYHKSYSIK